MIVYRLAPDYDARGNSPWDWLSYSNGFDDLDDLLKRPRLADRWKVPTVSLEREKGSGDFFYLSESACYAVNRSAMVVLQPFLTESVEFLRLRCKDIPELSVIHALQHVELARDADVHRIRGDNITMIRRHSFQEDALKGKHFFLVRQPPDSSAGKAGFACSGPLVSEEFKDLVEQHRLRGVSFEKVFPAP